MLFLKDQTLLIEFQLNGLTSYLYSTATWFFSFFFLSFYWYYTMKISFGQSLNFIRGAFKFGLCPSLNHLNFNHKIIQQMSLLLPKYKTNDNKWDSELVSNSSINIWLSKHLMAQALFTFKAFVSFNTLLPAKQARPSKA